MYELDKIDYDALRKRAQELIGRLENAAIEFAKILKIINDTQAYKKWGYETFKDYVQLELQLNKNKAQYYLRIMQGISRLQLTEEEIKALGLTKVKMLASATNSVDSQQLQIIKSMAKSEPVDVIEKKIRKLKNVVRDERAVLNKMKEAASQQEKMLTFQTMLYESVYTLLEATLEAIMKHIKTDSRNQAIAHLCSVYNAYTLNQGPIEDLLGVIAKLEEVFDVDITVTKDGQVIYPRE